MRGIDGKPYISLDNFIDVERLLAMNEEVCYGLAMAKHTVGNYGMGVLDDKILTMHKAQCLMENMNNDYPAKIRYNTIKDTTTKRKYLEYLLPVNNPSTTVYLRQPQGYENVRSGKRSQWDENNIKYFASLKKFVEELPFKEFGRVIIFVNALNNPILTHCDIMDNNLKHEKHRDDFIWFRTNMNKKFFIYDTNSEERIYVKSYSAFFNDRDYHGGDAVPMNTFSIRVDGIFTDEFRKQIGIDHLEGY